MSNKTFDALRQIAGIWAPVATFIVSIMSAWDIPYIDQVTKTLAAVTVLLNALVAFYRAQYKGGDPQ
jgi:hypothetical protein